MKYFFFFYEIDTFSTASKIIQLFPVFGYREEYYFPDVLIIPDIKNIQGLRLVMYDVSMLLIVIRFAGFCCPAGRLSPLLKLLQSTINYKGLLTKL